MPKRVIGLTVVLLAATCSALYGQRLKKVSFVPHWLPQAQFAGYYIAKDLGIYKKHGIDLAIVTGGPNVSSASLLEHKNVDFASMWLSNAIELKAKGADIVNLAQLINRSALMFVTKKSSGIKTPQDMNGKKIGLWGGDFQIRPQAFFKKYGLKVTTVLQGSSINLFFFDGIDVTSAMWYNEYHTILNAGFHPDELNTFFLADYGLNFPEEGIYCSRELLQSDSDTCRRFVRASLEGWQYSFEHPEAALDTVATHMREARLPVNRAHQRWMLARMKDLIFPAGKSEFQMLAEREYLFVAATLKETGSIKTIPSYGSLYRPVSTRGQR